MRTIQGRALLGVAAVCFGMWAAGSEAADAPKDGKPAKVQLGKLESTAPKDWKAEKPANRLRLYQFRIPHVKDDKSDADVTILDLRGTVESNVSRWKGEFIPPDGKTVDDIAKVEKIQVGKATATVVDISGTWVYKERPFDPKSKEEQRPNSRVISVAFDSGDGLYRIRFAGPAATVTAHHKEFMDWLKAFK